MADHTVNGIKVPFIPVVPDKDFTPDKLKKGTDTFDVVFRKELEKIKFSNHASERMQIRNIQLTDENMKTLQEAVQKAEEKGGRDSLIMMNDKAFIINVPNKTVITALDVSEEKQKVFTNIDSVVFT